MPLPTTTTEALHALERQGVAAHMASRLAASHTPDLIGQWCAYKARHKRMGPGALINAIRYGAPPPDPTLKDQSTNTALERILEWLRRNLPELCDKDGQPHVRATTMVMLLEHRHGKGALSVAEHGPTIRAAVAAWEHEYGGEQ